MTGINLQLLRNLILLFLLFSFGNDVSAGSIRSVADPNMVICGQARFTVLTPELIRMEWDEKMQFEDRSSLTFINRQLSPTDFSRHTDGDWLIITTQKLRLYYKINGGQFNAQNLKIEFLLNGQQVVWHPGLEDKQNLKGTTRTLDDTNGDFSAIKLEDGLISRSGWCLIDDTRNHLFDGSKDWNWIIPRKAGNHQDLYFFAYGHDYKKAVFDFTRVAGKIPMPPKYAFGYWWSRYWTYSDTELKALVNDFKTYNIPMDVMVIDMDWHNTWGLDHKMLKDKFGEPIGWTGYTWNKNLFPEPSLFLDWAKKQGLKIALNLHPASGIAPMESQYNTFARAYGFDTTAHENIPFLIEDKKWAKTYFDVVLRPIEKQGIDFWWLDWQQWLENKQIKGLSNTFWLNYTFFSNKEKGDHRRPLLFHRWGGLGNHRYQIGFSGDTHSTWNSLAYQPYFTATAGNVGYGYWSHDIGGHVATDPDPELYLRWIQYGVFSPILRTHSAKNAFNERRIWKFPEFYKPMLSAFKLRYALHPYLYTASREAYDTGLSICRPLYYDYPEEDRAYEYKGQYLFGDDMLLAPITEKADSLTKMSLKRIWLPKGTWYDLYNGTSINGDQVVERSYTLQQIPVMIKAGSIIPMYHEIKSLQQKVDQLVLSIIPGDSGNARMYEDDGSTDGYQSNRYAFTSIIKETDKNGTVLLKVLPQKGAFNGMSGSRRYELRFLSTFPPEEISVNGRKYNYQAENVPGSWTYDGQTLSTVVNIPNMSCTEVLTIRFVPAKGAAGKTQLLNGKVGLFASLQNATEQMKYESAKSDWVANAPEILLELANIPTQIHYHPEQATALLEKADALIKPCLLALKSYPAADERMLEQITGPLTANNPALLTMNKPEITISNVISENAEMATIVTDAKDAEIHYTLDGTLPELDSQTYHEPILLNRSTLIKARVFHQSLLPSFTAVQNFSRLKLKKVTYEQPYSPQYAGSGPQALIDGQLGELKTPKNNWIGFNGHDMTATVELKKSGLKTIITRFMQAQDIWVFLPRYLKYELSPDGIHYKTVYEFSPDAGKRGENGIFEFRKDITSNKDRYLRITARQLEKCPLWHQGAGLPPWLFTDELIIE